MFTFTSSDNKVFEFAPKSDEPLRCAPLREYSDVFLINNSGEYSSPCAYQEEEDQLMYPETLLAKWDTTFFVLPTLEFGLKSVTCCFFDQLQSTE